MIIINFADGSFDSPDDTDLFTLSIVNSYGSQEVKKLKDDNNSLKLTSECFNYLFQNYSDRVFLVLAVYWK